MATNPPLKKGFSQNNIKKHELRLVAEQMGNIKLAISIGVRQGVARDSLKYY
jgi:hypothetical protein